MRPSVRVAEFDGEVVLLSLDSGEYYSFNEVGTTVWKLANRGLSLADIATALERRYGISSEQAYDDAHSFLRRLVGENLLGEMEAAPDF